MQISTQAYRPRPADAPVVTRPAFVDAATQHAIEQFLFFEAQLLDEARYNDWYDLLHEDIRYRMPLRRTRLHRDLPLESTGSRELAHYDDVAKTAAIRLSENIAAETQGQGVAAFSLHPGGVVNPSIARAIERGIVAPERYPDSPHTAARMIADLAEGRYDVLSGAYLDVNDDLAALAAQRTPGSSPTRVLRVVDLPADWQAKPRKSW